MASFYSNSHMSCLVCFHFCVLLITVTGSEEGIRPGQVTRPSEDTQTGTLLFTCRSIETEDHNQLNTAQQELLDDQIAATYEHDSNPCKLGFFPPQDINICSPLGEVSSHVHAKIT